MSEAKNNPASLKLDHIRIKLGQRQLIALDREIAPGEVLTVMGDSGSGKSTLLDFVAGFLDPAFNSEGQVWLGERNITQLPAQERKVGLMFQTPLLFPHMSVAQNLLFGLKQDCDGDASDRRAYVAGALREVGLEDCGDRDPATLSGGQQTRVALMRLLLAEPKALLLDEPFSSLDQTRRADIRKLVFSLAREKELPVLLVTHDPEDAAAAGGDIVCL